MNKELSKGLLLNEQGDLNEAGFSLSLIKEYQRSQIHGLKWRIKEWDYYYIGNQDYGLCLTISDVSFLALISVTFLDFKNKLQPAKTILKPFTFGKVGLPSSSKAGDVFFKNKQIDISFVHEGDKRHLKVHLEKFLNEKALDADVILEETQKDTIVVATPFFKKRHFYYNQKINLLKARGYFSFGDLNHQLKQESLGVLDWGRGIWTYSNTWYWSSLNATQYGHRIGFNLGYGFGDTSHASENMFFYDDQAYKLDDVKFNIPKNKKDKLDFIGRWTITSDSGDIDLIFHPIIDRYSNTNALIIQSNQHQVFGYFSGKIKVNNETYVLDHLLGFAEMVKNRW